MSVGKFGKLLKDDIIIVSCHTPVYLNHEGSS